MLKSSQRLFIKFLLFKSDTKDKKE